MKWHVVRRDRSQVRLELIDDARICGRPYISLAGSIANGYEWYSNAAVMGLGGFGGEFKDQSQDAAIETAIGQWKLRLREVVDVFLSSDFTESVEKLDGK